MKKRIITLLAVLALLVACMVVAAQAETTAAFDPATFNCPCSKCNGTPYNGTWITSTEIDADKTLLTTPADGAHIRVNKSYSSGIGSFSIGADVEAVIVFDNNYVLSAPGTSRSMLIQGKLHLIGTGANSIFMSSTKSTSTGPFAQIYNNGELHLYGELLIKMHGNATPSPTASGLFRLAKGKIHLHDAPASMNLPTTKDPTLTASTLAGTGSSNQGGICKVESSSCEFTMDAGTLNGNPIKMKGLDTNHQVGRGGLLYNNGGTININGGTLNGGSATNGGNNISRGGLIYNGSGTLNITGGTFNANSAMTGDYRGICIAGGTVNFSGGTINSANISQGDGIGLLSGTLTMSGSATVKNANGTLDNNIFRWSTENAEKYEMNPAVFQLDKDWNGSASIDLQGHGKNNLNGAILKDYLFFGIVTDGVFAPGAGTTKALSLYLEDTSFENPQLHGTTQYIVPSRAALKADGEVVSWHLETQGAVNAYASAEGANKYVKVWTDYVSNSKDTTATAEVYVDLNGYNQTDWALGDGGVIYAFDSAAKAGAVGATINVATQPVTQINGKTYFTKAVDGTTTVYPVEYKLTQVALRAASEGIYYKGSLKAHEDLGATMGIAVTVADDPAANSLEQYLYTEETASGEHNGVLVQNILNNATTVNAEKLVKARAYIKVDGRLYMSDIAQYSLKGLVEQILENDLYTGQAGFKDLYNKLTTVLEYQLPELPNIQNSEEA